jgi:PPM family protein phosphatase
MTTVVECRAGPDDGSVRSADHLRFESALVSIAGPRPDNQDAGTAGPRLVAVADGVGGNVGGAVASSLVVDAVGAALQRPSPEPCDDRLATAVLVANEILGRAIAADPSLSGMATTLTAVALEGDRLTVAHVGDTRAYLLRDGRLRRLTRDQTVVQSLLDAGLVDDEDVRTHLLHSVLLGALRGDGDDGRHVERHAVHVVPGDRVLVCSDGLSGVVSPALIELVLRAEARPEAAATRLARAALAAGTRDNVTAAVADLVPTSRPGAP